MNNHHESVVLNRKKKEQRGKEFYNISNYSHWRAVVQRLVDLVGREEHWVLYCQSCYHSRSGVWEMRCSYLLGDIFELWHAGCLASCHWNIRPAFKLIFIICGSIVALHPVWCYNCQNLMACFACRTYFKKLEDTVPWLARGDVHFSVKCLISQTFGLIY